MCTFLCSNPLQFPHERSNCRSRADARQWQCQRELACRFSVALLPSRATFCFVHMEIVMDLNRGMYTLTYYNTFIQLLSMLPLGCGGNTYFCETFLHFLRSIYRHLTEQTARQFIVLTSQYVIYSSDVSI